MDTLEGIMDTLKGIMSPSIENDIKLRSLKKGKESKTYLGFIQKVLATCYTH